MQQTKHPAHDEGCTSHTNNMHLELELRRGCIAPRDPAWYMSPGVPAFASGASAARDTEPKVPFTVTRYGGACTNVPVIYKVRDRKDQPDAAVGAVVDVFFHTLDFVMERTKAVLEDTAGKSEEAEGTTTVAACLSHHANVCCDERRVPASNLTHQTRSQRAVNSY
jgi:hypothetical protein